MYAVLTFVHNHKRNTLKCLHYPFKATGGTDVLRLRASLMEFLTTRQLLLAGRGDDASGSSMLGSLWNRKQENNQLKIKDELIDDSTTYKINHLPVFLNYQVVEWALFLMQPEGAESKVRNNNCINLLPSFTINRKQKHSQYWVLQHVELSLTMVGMVL